MAGKRRWIAYAAVLRGRVVVNDGAREAILRGKASLLASGVVRVEREFEPQDVLSIADPSGREFARGIAIGALGGTIGFFTSGLVHYNWGDSEVVTVFYFIMGLCLVVEWTNQRTTDSGVGM